MRVLLYKHTVEGEELEAYTFDCPGCKITHVVDVKGHPKRNWGFNGSVDRPTFTPSLLVKYKKEGDARSVFDGVCHSFIKEGKIQFLGDCTHELKGQTVDLKEYPNKEDI